MNRRQLPPGRQPKLRKLYERERREEKAAIRNKRQECLVVLDCWQSRLSPRTNGGDGARQATATTMEPQDKKEETGQKRRKPRRTRWQRRVLPQMFCVNGRARRSACIETSSSVARTPSSVECLPTMGRGDVLHMQGTVVSGNIVQAIFLIFCSLLRVLQL